MDNFRKIKAFYISLFLKIEIEITLTFLKIKIEIYIFDQPLFGIKYEKHNIIQKFLTKLLYEGFNQFNYINNNIRELN